jgi:hypothetical protein
LRYSLILIFVSEFSVFWIKESKLLWCPCLKTSLGSIVILWTFSAIWWTNWFSTNRITFSDVLVYLFSRAVV